MNQKQKTLAERLVREKYGRLIEEVNLVRKNKVNSLRADEAKKIGLDKLITRTAELKKKLAECEEEFKKLSKQLSENVKEQSFDIEEKCDICKAKLKNDMEDKIKLIWFEEIDAEVRALLDSCPVSFFEYLGKDAKQFQVGKFKQIPESFYSI